MGLHLQHHQVRVCACMYGTVALLLGLTQCGIAVTPVHACTWDSVGGADPLPHSLLGCSLCAQEAAQPPPVCTP